MWRIAVVLREAWTSFTAERWRAAVLIGVIGLATAVLVATELDQAKSAVAAADEHRAAGRYVFVARSEEGGAAIDATQCLALQHNPAVLAAGGQTPGGRVTLVKAPGEVFDARLTVGRMMAILAPTTAPSVRDLYVSDVAAARAGLVDGRAVGISGGDTPARVGVVNMRARVPDPGPWVWVPASPAALLDECWVEVVPTAGVSAIPWLAAWLSNTEGTVIVAPLLGDDRLRKDPLAVFLDRPTQLAWLPVGGAVGLALWLVTWFRRSELALYRTVGSSRGQTVLLHIVPHTAMIAIGAFAGALYGAFIHVLGSPDTTYVWPLVLRHSLLVFSTATVVATLGPLSIVAGSVAGHIRDRL